jgi:hypothetical protein
MTMLRNALILLLAAAPACAEEAMPAFNLNAIHVKDMLDHTLNPELFEGIRAYDMTPGAPQPECLTEDGRPAPKPPVVEFYPLYDGEPGPDLPPPLSRSGYVQMVSSTRLKLNKKRGELTLAFPAIIFLGRAFGDRADLFVRMTGTAAAPAISWATVLCAGDTYLGYKGSTVNLPRRSVNYSINEAMALGAPKALITQTHGWLTEGMITTEELCSKDFRARMKDARAATLPKTLGPYAFSFDPKKNVLRIKWENK